MASSMSFGHAANKPNRFTVDHNGMRYRVDVRGDQPGVNWRAAAIPVIEYLETMAKDDDHPFKLTQDMPITVDFRRQDDVQQPVLIERVQYGAEGTDVDEKLRQRVSKATQSQLISLNKCLHREVRPSRPAPRMQRQDGPIELPPIQMPENVRAPAFVCLNNPDPNAFRIETGGGGNCGPSSLADAEFRLQGLSPENRSREIHKRKQTIRQDVAQWLFNSAEDHDLCRSHFFEHTLWNDLHTIQRGIPLSREERVAFTHLMASELDSLTNEQRTWLMQLYARHIAATDMNVDASFLRAYAILTNTPVAVVQTDRRTKQLYIAQVIPSTMDQPEEAPDLADAVFIYCDPPRHYQSINRNHGSFQAVIDEYLNR